MSAEATPPILEQQQQPGVLERAQSGAVRGALIVATTLATFAAQEAIGPTVAHADTTSSIAFANDYPYAAALIYNEANYDWWVDENGNGQANVTPNATDNDETMSPYLYGYRNCTDGAAYWVSKYLGMNVSGWHHGKDWDEGAAAQNVPIKAGNASDIEPGDIAQSDDGTYGHVGFVTDVVKNPGGVVKIRVAELNKDQHGNFTHDWYDSKNSSGKFIRSGSGRDWDHFIDVNGPTPTTPEVPPLNSYGPKNVTVVPNVLGGLSVFAANSGNTLSYKDQSYAGEDLVTKPWGTLPEHIKGQPEIVQYPNGAMSVFSHGDNDHLYHAWQTGPGTAWSGEISPWNVSLRGEPTAAFNFTGGVSAFFPDSNGEMREIDQIGTGGDLGTAPVHNLAGNLQGKPAVMNIDGAFALFAHGADGKLYTKYQPTQGGSWSGWEVLGNGQKIQGDPKVIINRLGGMTLLAVGEGGDLIGIDQAYKGESMNKPFYSLAKPAGIEFAGTPAIIQTVNGEQMVFATSTGGRLYHKAQVGSSYYNWTDFFHLGGNFIGAPTVVKNSAGGVSVFGRNPDGTVITVDQPGYGAAFNTTWFGIGKP